MYFCVNEFEVGINDSMFFGNEQKKVYWDDHVLNLKHLVPEFFITLS